MTSIGEQANNSCVARKREADYIRNFQHQFRNGMSIVHPATGEVIRLADWSDVEYLEDEVLQLGYYLNMAALPPEQQWNYPNNTRVLYWIEPKSLGIISHKYPKVGFVIECAILSRLERWVMVGHDEESLGVPTVEQLLQERHALVQRWSARYGTPVTYLVGLASTTGWNQESIGYVHNFVNNVGLQPYLVDLVTLNVYSSNTQQKSIQYCELFELPLGDKKINQIAAQIKDILLATGASRFTELQTEITCSQGLLSAACTRLAQTSHEYRILQGGGTLIIRSD